jgi:hypothetical protein
MNLVLKSHIKLAVLVTVNVLLALQPSSQAVAFQVSPLPAYNLIQNPWFRSASEPNYSGLDGWIDAAGQNKYWSTSQKESNPSPDIVINGICDNKPVYCGTSARLKNTPGQSGGLGVPGVDSYLYQVVAANKSNTKLIFFTHWVSHRIDPAEVLIYGGESANGPWTEEPVWVPFYHVQYDADNEVDLWTQTDFLEKTISQGYNYYKIVIHARLPDDDTVGFKITGIYFTALGPGNPIPPVQDEMRFLPIINKLNSRQ